MKVFGYEAFVHVDKELITKLEAKSKRCTLIGYEVGEFGYHMWDYLSKKILRRRGVVLNETLMYKDHLQKSKKGKANEE